MGYKCLLGTAVSHILESDWTLHPHFLFLFHNFHAVLVFITAAVHQKISITKMYLQKECAMI